MIFNKKVFICSPYAPISDNPEDKKEELGKNILLAQIACAKAVSKGAMPYAPHLYFTQILDDDAPAARLIGQRMGHEWMKECDEIWIVGRRISEGMKKEMELAEVLGIPFKHYVFKRTREERLIDALIYPEIEFNEL